MNKKRECNIELLRIVLMLMIILFHLIVHGCKIKTLSTNNYVATNKDFIYLSLLAFLAIAVNCFVFISGYYGIKFKIKTLINFSIQAIFYSVIIYSIAIFIFRIDIFDPRTFIRSFFPLATSVWWFFTVFIGIYLLSPLINKGIDAINKYQLVLIIIILVYLGATYPFLSTNALSGDGLNLYTLLTVYIIGRFCKKNEIEINHAFIKYGTMSVILFGIIYIAYINNMQVFAWRMTTYNSFFIIINSILFFYGFKNISIKDLSIIYKVAPLTFGIYLIHDHLICATYLKRLTFKISNMSTNPLYILFLLLTLTVLIFVSCAIIEYIRIKICTPIVNLINSRVEKATPFLLEKTKQLFKL